MSSEPVSPPGDGEGSKGAGGGPASLVDEAVGWARAVAFGLRDTFHDVLEEGRKGARTAQETAWRRYEQKTRQRRRRRD